MARKIKVIEYTGNGKSWKTAISFKAKDDEEHVRMQHSFMRERGIISRKQTLVEIEGDKHLYDVHETSEGELWFKIPRGLRWE